MREGELVEGVEGESSVGSTDGGGESKLERIKGGMGGLSAPQRRDPKDED